MRVHRYKSRWIGALAIALWSASPASAQGWIEPPLLGSGFAIDKTRSEVRMRVRGRVAEVEVTEWFHNGGTRVAEGHYLYPLPGEAVFQGFSLFQGEDELRGEIMGAAEARRIYEDIVRRRADPALIELAGHGLLRARVFPIEPGDERKVTLRYTQVVERAGNALEIVYAGAVRGTEVGAPGEAPEGRPLAEPMETRFDIEIEDGGAFLEPFSPTHEIDSGRDGDVLWVSMDREVVGRFALFLPLAEDGIGLSVATHKPVGEDGFFMLTLSPGPADGPATPRDVTVALDVSGSMSGDKIVQARQALHRILGSLGREDRFRLLAFSNAVRLHSEEWAPATGYELSRARSWVDELIADGGTNIEEALTESLRLPSPEERLPVVVFVTDGLPTVGEQSVLRLADRAERDAGRARVFAFGVGHDVNTHLLDRLGEAGRGATDYVQPGESVERAVAALATRIRHPVLTDLELRGGPVELREIYPERIPDVFAGEELILFGRYRGAGQARLTVRGQRAAERVEHTAEARFADVREADAYLPRLWASRKLGHLQRLLWTEGETPERVAEIRALALRYGLPSEYTSYLVQEPEVFADPADVALRTPQLPGVTPAVAAARSAGGAVGERAVRRAEAARRFRDARSLDEVDSLALQSVIVSGAPEGVGPPTRMIAGRLFRLDDGVWTDARHRPDTRVLEVKAFGGASFSLLDALPELRLVLREASEVLIAGERISLRFGDDGVEELDAGALSGLVGDFRGEGGAR